MKETCKQCSEGPFEPLKTSFKIVYEPPSAIHIFLLFNAITNYIVPGSYFVAETEEELVEDIKHFKFLAKYNLI